MLPPPPAVAAERADAVLEARVDGVSGSTDPTGPGVVRYELAVLRVFKGDVAVTAHLVTRASSAACGRSFVVGKRYLIYAGRNDDGDLTDTLCSRTRLITTADEDLAVLGAGAPPMSAPANPDVQNREPPRIEPPPLPAAPATARRGCEIGGLGGAGGLVLLAALAPRRRRRM